eukprot:4400555-Pyramimonas_sp.AAC.1
MLTLSSIPVDVYHWGGSILDISRVVQSTILHGLDGVAADESLIERLHVFEGDCLLRILRTRHLPDEPWD